MSGEKIKIEGKISDLYKILSKRGGEATFKKYGREHYIRMNEIRWHKQDSGTAA